MSSPAFEDPLVATGLAIHSPEDLNVWYTPGWPAQTTAWLYHAVCAAWHADAQRSLAQRDALIRWLQSSRGAPYGGWDYARELLGLLHASSFVPTPVPFPLDTPDVVFHVIRQRLVSQAQWAQAFLACLTPLEKVFDFDPSGHLAIHLAPLLAILGWTWIEPMPGLTFFTSPSHRWMDRAPAPPLGTLVAPLTPGIRDAQTATVLLPAWVALSSE